MPVSPTNRAILERLRLSLWRTDAKLSRSETLGVLNQIDAASEPGAIPYILDFLLSSDSVVSASAAATIEQIVKVYSSLELVRLDFTIRERGYWRWEEIRAVDVDRLSHGHSCVLGILSCHRSGFIREWGVRSLSLIDDGRELPFLLLRLNDWVAEVRDAARSAVLGRVRLEYAEHFVRHLPLVFRLMGQNRDDHREIIEHVSRMLRNPECRSALLREICSSDRDVSRAAFRFLLSFKEGETDALDQGFRSEDRVIRLTAARAARVTLEGPSLAETLARMKSDRFMPIRREALYGYVERLSDLAPAELVASLWDAHPSIRETARFYLRKSGQPDFAGLYRAKLDAIDADFLALAIAGLGETGGAEDALRIEDFIAHPSAKVRRAAVRAIGRLNPEPYMERLLTLIDDVAGVAKAAGDILADHIYLLKPKRLWELFEKTTSRSGRMITLGLFNRLAWWDSAPLLVAAAGSGDEILSQRSLRYLERWRRNYHRLTARPSREKLTLLEEMRRLHGASLDKPAIDDLDSHISYAKRELV